MANLRTIRKRIASVKNTRQITRAMKLMSGAKLKRATDAAVAARPYSQKLKEILQSLLERMEDRSHPLFQEREAVKKVSVLVFNADRGLCGSYNSNVHRQLDGFMRERAGLDVQVITIGRKVRDHVRRKGYPLNSELSSLLPAEYLAKATQLAREALQAFSAGEVDEVYLIYHRFRSAISQVLTTERVLPLSVPQTSSEPASVQIDFLYEPGQGAVLDFLLPELVTGQFLQAFLEANASEHGARMTAMENATRNASEMIGRLTLEYNRARQAAITKELMEIISGAEALR